MVIGHWVALACGFASLAIVNAWSAPNAMTANHFVAVRVWACVIAVTLTALFTLLLKAGQPAAYSTTLLIAIGSMQRPSDAWAIALAVLILGFVGEPIRRLRLTPPQRKPQKLKAA